MKKRFVFFLAVGFSMVSFLVFAQAPASTETGGTEKGLESLLFSEIPMVKSTGFFATKATKSPGYVTVVTAKNIEDSPARDLRDVLNYFVPGMSELIHEGVGPMVAVRGIGMDSNAKTLFMLDGQQLNHRQHFGYATETALPLLGDISELEISNGPSAIVHGSGAISGFVNMFPKSGKDFPGWFINTEYGFKEELYKTEVGYGKSFGAGRDLCLYGGILEANGAKTDRPWVVDATGGEDNNSLLAYKVRANAFPGPIPTSKLAAYLNYDDFNLNAFFLDETMGIPGEFNRAGDGGEKTAWSVTDLGIRPKYTFHPSDLESLDLLGSLLLMQQGHCPDSPIAKYGSTTFSGGNDTEREFDKESDMEIKTIGRTTRFKGHSLAVGGLVGRRNFKVNDTYFHGGSENTTGEAQSTHWTELALFAEDVAELTDAWTASLGWRYDEVRYAAITSLPNNPSPTNAQNVSWRAATAYELNPTSSVKLSFQEGFRYPDLAYTHWRSVWNKWFSDHGYAARIPELTPEKMNSTELNYHKEFREIKTKVDLNVYYNVYDKTLHWHTFGTTNAGVDSTAVAALIADQGWMGAHINAPGKFRTEGFELIGTWQPLDNITATLSYGFSKATNVPDDVYNSFTFWTSNGAWILYPTHQVKGLVVTKWFADRLTLSCAPTYQSAVNRLKRPAGDNIGYIYDHPRFVTDISGEYQITKKLSTKLTIKNLFETNVPPRDFKMHPYQGAIGTDARYWYISVKYQF